MLPGVSQNGRGLTAAKGGPIGRWSTGLCRFAVMRRLCREARTVFSFFGRERNPMTVRTKNSDVRYRFVDVSICMLFYSVLRFVGTESSAENGRFFRTETLIKLFQHAYFRF